MTLLFDVSPDEPTRKRGRAKSPQSRAQAVQEQEPEKTFSYIGNPPPPSAILPIGRIDGVLACIDTACEAGAIDILFEEAGEWYLSCAFCGTSWWAKAIKGHLKPKEDEFVLRDGRFAGMTLDEVEREPRGLDYLRWAAVSHPRQAVTEAARRHIDRSQASS